jgi:ACS family glucarate transporter-like MFS transporter
LAAWLVFFNTPEKVSWLGTQERDKILNERDAKASHVDDRAGESGGLLALMRSPTLWGLAITQGCNVYTQYLFLTWLPSYLQTTRQITIAHTGVLAAIPYAASVVFCVLVGRLSDRYLKKGGVGTGRRRNAVAVAMTTGATILAVPFISNLSGLLVIFSITLAGIASTTSLNFALLNDLLPNSRDIAKAMAFLVVGGNVFGMIAPIATGYVIHATGSYNWAFGIAGSLLLVGALVVLTMTRSPMTRSQARTRAEATA